MAEMTVANGLTHERLEHVGAHVDQLFMIASLEIDFRLFRDGVVD